MPKKSVREMSLFERRRYSLPARTMRAILMGCVILGLVAQLIGLSFYALALSRQYINNASNIAHYAHTTLTHGQADTKTYAKEVMSIYNSLSEEERAQTGTDEYRARFAELENGRDYDFLIHMLGGFLQYSEVFDVYLGMYDEEHSRLVYMVDPEESARLYPGEWESVSADGIHTFLYGDDSKPLYEIEKTENYGWLCTVALPIRDDNNEILAFVLVDLTIGNIIEGMKEFSLNLTIGLLIVTALIAWVMSRYLKKTVVTPVNAIADAAVSYVKDKRAGSNSVNHFSNLNIRTGDELENLSLVMSDMEKDLADYEDHITRITAEKQRISTELHMATVIQASMLPHVFPPYPNRSEFDIYASMTPAKEVGGDFYDFFLVDDDHLCMVMADVSGKGVPAALFMMISKVIVQSCAMLGQSVGEILNKTNEALCSNNQVEMFVTIWIGMLELSTGKLTAANAGHEYPAINFDGQFELYKDKHGFVVGGMSNVKYREYEMQLKPGDRIFVYTDGVAEAMNSEQKLFGTKRMIDALNVDPMGTPKQILGNVQNAVSQYVGDAEQFDDLTMMCLVYKGPDETKKHKSDKGE